MPVNGEKIYHTGVFRLSSPTHPQPKITKRKRNVVSCVPCRTRKLKCDRQQPCASCVKRHDEPSCKFYVRPVQRDASPTHGPAVQRNEMRTKLKRLEDLVSDMMGQPQSSSAGAADGAGVSAEYPTRFIDTGGGTAGPSRSRLRLPTDQDELQRDDGEAHPMGSMNYFAVLDSIRDLQGFVDADFASPASARAEPAQRPRSSIQAHGDKPRGIFEEALKCLPQRPECDNILSFFFQQIYMVPMVFHAGQFQRIYEQFWKDPSSVSPLWLSMLLGLMSTSFFQQAAKASPSAPENMITLTEMKSRVAECSSMAYRCLIVGNHLQGGPFSVEATLVFAMHLVIQKRDSDPQCWHMIGIAVRLAQRAGYHRDAKRLGRDGTDNGISPFEAEMRRRTWSTLEYFDIFFSFRMGIPPIINVDLVDITIPSNLRDEDFDEDSSSLPRSRPTTELTPLLVYAFLSKQVKLLHRVVQQALALKQPSYLEVLSLDDDLTALHNEIPPGLRWRPIRESGLADIPDVIMRRISCETIHLKCLCILHRRYLTFERQNGAYERSRKACVDASLRLLHVQFEFDENSGESGRLYGKRYLLSNLGYHDFLLAAMCICLDLVIGSRDGKVQSYECKVEALKRARAIWHRMAERSVEAAHATQVLDQILSRVPSPDHRRDPRANKPQQTSASMAHVTGAAAGDNSNADIGASELPRTGSHLLSRPAQPIEQGWSREWDMGKWDEIGDRVSRDLGGSSEGALRFNVDWDQIDSFVFARQPGPGFSLGGAPISDDSEREYTMENTRDSTENWPYPTWNDRVDGLHGGGTTHGRTWSAVYSPWPDF